MRIAYFAEIFPSPSETWVHNEIKELQALGCEVAVFATHARPKNIPPDVQALAGITTYRPELSGAQRGSGPWWLRSILLKAVFNGLIREPVTPRQVAQVLRDAAYIQDFEKTVLAFAPDVVMVHFAGTRTNLAYFLQRLHQVPYVVKMHAADVFTRVAMLRTKVRWAARTLTISGYNLDYIRANYPDVDSARIHQQHCGVVLTDYPFDPPPARRQVPEVVAVGRLIPMKGFHVLIEAIGLLRDRGVPVSARIIGDGPERERLRDLIVRNNLDSQVTLEGYLPAPQVRELVRSADLFALPAIWDEKAHSQDGIPVALMEAMALGVPVISSRLSGIPELIQDGISGFLAQPGDPRDLADGIERSFRLAPAARSDQLRAARAVMESSFDARALTGELLETLRSVAATAPQRHSPGAGGNS